MTTGDDATPAVDRCDCFRLGRKAITLHSDEQDTGSAGWARLLELIDEAAADGREEFRPLAQMSSAQRRDVVTLPPEIGRLTAVRHLVLYGSNLVRIPPEIGRMASLEVFQPYTSYRLHWFPYELTRCARLRDSTVSTRAVYGNPKNRMPFPALRAGAGHARTCSVCDKTINGAPRQVWVTRLVGTDHLPLLVNACSVACATEAG